MIFRFILFFTLIFSHVKTTAKDLGVSIPLSGSYTTRFVSACGNGADASITAVPSGGTAPYTYSWTGMTGIGALIPYTAGNVSTISNLLIGYYEVTITDAASNSIVLSNIHIGYAFYVYITNSGSISSSCQNTGSIILYGNAGVQPYTYSLDGVTYQAGNTFSNLAPNTYTAYMKDFAGCVSSKSINVMSVAPVAVTAFIRPASSCSSDGAIELYRTGGIPPYTYSLDNITYQASNTFSGLAGGLVVTGWVKDSKGCKGSLPGITVTQGTGLEVSISKTPTSTCIVDGTLQFNATGGIPPYVYSLNNITYQASNSFTGLPATNYYGWVKDSRGCKGTGTATIALNPIIVTAYAIPASACGSMDGTIELFHTGGTSSFSYSLDGNNYQLSNVFTGLAAGTYSGYVKDSKICIGVLDIVVGPSCP